MKKYIQLLENLDPCRTLIGASSRTAVLLSGQSDFAHAELSTPQKDVLDVFARAGFAVVRMGFPFHKDHAYEGCPRASMAVASWRNVRQFWEIIADRGYGRLIARHVQPLFLGDGTRVIVCQSLGLQMMRAALPFVAIAPGLRVTLIALGPVVWGGFDDHRFKLIVVKGRYDWVSRVFDRLPVDHWVSCHHMDYCGNTETTGVIRAVIGDAHQG